MDWTHTIKAVEEAGHAVSEAKWKAGNELGKEAVDRAGLRACAKELKRHGHSPLRSCN